MAEFSSKERLIASLLSSMPMVKSVVKQSYVRLNALIYRKPYKHRINAPGIKGIETVSPVNPDAETFFGYYDKSPENAVGVILFNETDRRKTSKKPSADVPVKLMVFNHANGSSEKIAESYAYNWQQGCRAQWIDNDRIIFNAFEHGKYVSKLWSCKARKVVAEYMMPVQDSFGDKYFLAVNYRRIMKLRPDYGYRNLPLPSAEEMNNLENDGLWRVDYKSGESVLVLSLKEISEFEPQQSSLGAGHKINHVMISPDGKSCIFIHRWYVGKRRFDRLVYYDFDRLRVLAADNMVSHMCWIDNATLFGYLRHQGVNGFYFIDIASGSFTPCNTVNALRGGDGHPSAYGDWIVFDSYPDKSRMQHLYLYNRKTDKLVNLLEVYHSTRYMGETRCDLHPRFSADGGKVFFDTVFKGKRRLAFVDVASIVRR